MEILSAEQMREVDRRAIDDLGIASLLLMEAAGTGVAERILRDLAGAARAGTLVLCGKGNNGGDGLVVARHLARRRLPVAVWLAGAPGELAGDAAINLCALHGSGVPVLEALPELGELGLVVDAMLGTGVRGGARGAIAEAIEALTGYDGPVVAVDLPSGLDADAVNEGAVLRATHTYTLCRPKPALLDDAAAALVGRLDVVPIGIPDACVAEIAGEGAEWLAPDRIPTALGRRLPARPADGHKGTFGHLLVVAGSRDAAGAATLCGSAALRAGAGLVTVATAASAREAVVAARPELMTRALAEDAAGAIDVSCAEAVQALIAERDALACGPGLGDAAALVHALRFEIPTVLDADALNAFPGAQGLRAGEAPLVLTPHPAEAGRLLGIATERVQADRPGAARALAERTGATVVLKGRHTIVQEPSGRRSLCTAGNPGMATAGSGDVLTGIIGALLAAGLDGRDAARLGVWLHASAGDLAAATRGEASLIAGDLILTLGAAYARVGAAAAPRDW